MLPTDYQEYIHKSRYARYLDDKGRRENWDETVDRYIENVVRPHVVDDSVVSVLRGGIASLEVMPSMRGLMTAGAALERDNAAIFNCAYLPVDHPRSFDEAMYILLCGTGVGFSVERQYVSKLPEVAEEFHDSSTVIHVRDSKIGWATSFKELLALLYDGQVPQWDVSKIRPHGARLKTFGGRASGPEPLVELFKFAVATFKGAAGRKLTSLECHDIMCKVGEAVVVGGVRRSAMISLSNLSDDRMRHAKTGVFPTQRWLANNSICFTEKPDFPSFLREWTSLYESKNGERGFFNRVAARKQAGKNGRRETNHEFGTNPCSEIILRPYQFCNLTEVVVRAGDSLPDLERKVRMAALLGTVQAKFTNFRYLRPIWKRNTEEEALLGVSLTGVMDHPVLSQTGPEASEWLAVLKDAALLTNAEWAPKLGVNVSTAITCVKPSGTVSQLTNTASGLHPRWSGHYIRRVRADVKDPLSSFLKAQGVPWEEALGNPSTLVFSFPQEAPRGALTRHGMTAIGQLEHWLMVQREWCEHKPSITVYYKDCEFMALGQWVWDHFDELSGVSFLPHSDHIYAQAPYEDITAKEFLIMEESFPVLEWDTFMEGEDNTTGTQTFACVGDKCEIT